MEHDHPDDDGDPWDLWLMATMEWEGGIPESAAKPADPDVAEKCPDGE